MIRDIINSVEDFEEQIKNESIRVCLLRPFSKISIKGWSGFLKYDEVMNLLYEENNLGIALTGSTYPGEPFLTCIDIDGDKRTLNSVNVEKFSKDWVYEIIVNKFKEKDISFLAVRSSSGGYHIYVYCVMESTRYGSCQDLCYPSSQESASVSDDMGMFLSAHRIFADELYGDEVPRGIVETWCQRRYMVAPGSVIEDSKTGETSTVELLPDGVQKFGDISIFKEDLNSVIREAMIEAGFKEEKKHNSVKKLKSEYRPKSLREEDIKMLGDFLLEYLPLIDGQKHSFCLAMSGFLYNKQIDIDSIYSICEYVTQRSGDLFKSNEQFTETLVHDTKSSDKSRLTTGLPTMADILSPFIPREILGKKLHLLTNPSIHKFWPDGTYANQYHEVLINFEDHYMVRNRIRTKLDKDGEISHVVMSNNKIFNNIDRLEYINDITVTNSKKKWEKPLRVYFTDTRKNQQFIDFKSVDACINGYNKIQGALGDHSKAIMENIINEFQTLDVIQEVESSSRTGIWFSPKRKQLVRYIEENGEIVENNPKKPARDDLINALNILKRINDVIPWRDGKFGYLIKTFFTIPYSSVLKYEYGSYHPFVLLYGESGTMKSTMSLLGVHLHLQFGKNDKDYVVSGGEMYSDYRFAKNMDRSSFPLIVEEPEQLFNKNSIRELIKSSAYNRLIREPGGTNSRPYYAMRSPVFTINNLPTPAEKPEYLRRFISIEFDRDEVCDTPEVLESLSFLNVDGHINYRFNEVYPIGDYIFNLLNNNLNWFTLSIEKIQDNIIEELEKETGFNLDFLKVDKTNFMYNDRAEHENSTLNSILKVLRRPYLYSRSKYISDKDSFATLKSIIRDNPEYSYVHFVKQKNKDAEPHVLIDIGFKEAYNSFYYNESKTITLNNVIQYFKDLDIEFDYLKMVPCYVEGRKNQVRGIRMSLKDFLRILTGKQEV